MIESIGGAIPCAPETHADEARERAVAEKGVQPDGREHVTAQVAAGAVSVQAVGAAPDRVDPEIWNQLDLGERDYFARAEALGPVTYGRGSEPTTAPATARGTHLDLRG